MYLFSIVLLDSNTFNNPVSRQQVERVLNMILQRLGYPENSAKSVSSASFIRRVGGPAVDGIRPLMDAVSEDGYLPSVNREHPLRVRAMTFEIHYAVNLQVLQLLAGEMHELLSRHMVSVFVTESTTDPKLAACNVINMIRMAVMHSITVEVTEGKHPEASAEAKRAYRRSYVHLQPMHFEDDAVKKGLSPVTRRELACSFNVSGGLNDLPVWSLCLCLPFVPMIDGDNMEHLIEMTKQYCIAQELPVAQGDKSVVAHIIPRDFGVRLAMM